MPKFQTILIAAVTPILLLTLTTTAIAATTTTTTPLTPPTAAAATTLPETITPVPREKRFRVRHNEILEHIKNHPVDLVFIGDSITDQWNTRGRATWDASFAQWNPANLGVGGDRTQNVLWRLTNGEFDGITPKVAVIMIGTNNTHSNTPEDIVLGIRHIINTVHTKSPDTKILLLAVFPRVPKMKDGELYTMPAEKVAQINKLLPALADGKRVRFLDIGHRFLVNGTVPKDIMPDGLHLSPAGYKVWAEAIMPTLQEMFAAE